MASGVAAAMLSRIGPAIYVLLYRINRVIGAEVCGAMCGAKYSRGLINRSAVYACAVLSFVALSLVICSVV